MIRIDPTCARRMLCACLLCVAFLAETAQGEPALEGEIGPINVQASVPGPDSNVTWQFQIQRKGSSFIRLHFSNVVDTGGGEFRIEVKDFNFQTHGSYTRGELKERSSFWSAMVPSDTAYVLVVPMDANKPPTVNFVLDQIMFESRGAKVLNIVGRDQRHWLIDYKEDHALQKAAASVAKLVFLRDGAGFTCTGFMITNDLMMTNRHCISTDAECRSAYAVFGFEFDANGRVRTGAQHACEAVAGVGTEDLDYAVLRLAGAPGRPEKFGSLPLRVAKVVEGMPLTMIQHPFGEPKQVSREDCAVKSPKAPAYKSATETDFGHTCDTLNGSSGSPVLDQSMAVVGLHHLGFDLTSVRWGRENRAVNVVFLLPDILKFIEAGK